MIKCLSWLNGRWESRRIISSVKTLETPSHFHSLEHELFLWWTTSCTATVSPSGMSDCTREPPTVTSAELTGHGRLTPIFVSTWGFKLFCVMWVKITFLIKGHVNRQSQWYNIWYLYKLSVYEQRISSYFGSNLKMLGCGLETNQAPEKRFNFGFTLSEHSTSHYVHKSNLYTLFYV